MPVADQPSTELVADCASCAALCCTALPFFSSIDFAFDKAAGVPCPNLDSGFGCRIHDQLRDRGFRGCAAYDCLGAGQRVVQHVFAGRTWRTHPEQAADMFAVFEIVRQLHELLWYLRQAARAVPSGPLHDRLVRVERQTDRAAGGAPAHLLRLDLAGRRREIDMLLSETSRRLRRAARPGSTPADHRHADLAGARLRGADLRGADLRSALLIAADLRGADLRSADLIAADLRDADLRDANLDGALYLTRNQVGSAVGNARTRLPQDLERPAHWTS